MLIHLAKRGANVEENQAELSEAGDMPDVCGCVVDHALVYLELLLHEAFVVLKRLHKATCHHEEAISWRLNGSFLHQLLPNAIQNMCVLLAQASTSTILEPDNMTHPPLALQFVDRIVPLLHPMLKMLDEVNWKLQSTNNNNQTHHETSDVATMLADSSHDNRNWVGELEDVCAMLCGKLCGVLVEHGHADPFTGQSSLSKAHRWIVDSLLGTSMIPKYSRADAVSEALPDAVSNILKWESLCVFEVENELPTSEDAADGAVMHTAPKDPAALQSRLAEWLDVQDIESMLLSMVLEQAGDTVREQVDRLPDGHRRALSTCVVGVTAAAVWNLGLVDALAVLLPHQQEVDNATSIDSSEALTSLLQVASNVLESIVGAKLPLSVHLKTAAAWTIAEPNPTVFAPLLAGGEPATSLINTVLVSLESPMDLVVAKQVMGWHDVQASLFRIGLGSFHDLLRKLTISSSKARLLGELTAVLARRQSLVPDELASLAMQQKHIDKTVENLYIRVAKVLTSEDSSVELKKKALVVWSAPLKIHDAEGKNSSTALAAKAGIVGILAELLHDDTPQDPKLTWGRLATVSSSCSSANQHLEAHALMFPSYTMGRPTHERADASHGHRLPPKLKAVESILFHQGSNEVLAAMAWEALCSVAMDFCTSAAFHQRDTLPLLSHGAAVPQASSRPSSAKDVTAPQRVITLSPRKRLTLPKKVVVSTEEETIDQLYDGLFSLLRRSCYDLEQQQDVIKHLTTLVIPVTPGADTAQPFLLGNPLCVGATTAQTVRSGAPAGPVRMSPATSSSDGTEKGWSVAFWVCVDQCTCREACKQFPTDRSPEQAPNPFVCIAAFGRDANKKTLLSEQEGTNATLNEDDPVDVIVFTHQLWSDRVILAVAVRAVGDDVDTSRGGEAAVPAGSSDGWTTHVIGETIRVGEWMHIAIVSCESDQRGSLTVYVDAKPVMTNAVCPATTPTRWTRMKAGGALSDSLIQRLALTPQPAVSSSSPSARTSVFAAVLDDVLVSSRPLQTQYIQLLSKEGPLLAQLRRQFTVNQSALAITKLLFEMMLHSPDLPAKSVQTSPSQHSTRWINALLSLLAVSDPDSLTQFYVLELLRRVLPRVHPSDSQTGLEVLKAVAKTIRDDAATSNGETTTAMPAITTARDVLWLVNSTFSKLPRSLQSFETLRQVLDQKGMLMTSAPNSMVTSDQPIRQSTAVRCTSLRRVFGIRLLQALWAAPTWSSCSSQFNTMATENVRRQLEAAKFADSIDECTDLAHALVFSSGGYCELSANQLSAMLLSHTPILLALTPYELPLQSPVGRLITDAQGAFLHAAKLLVTQAMAPGSRVVTARQDKKDATRDVQPVAYASATLLRMKSSVMRFLMMHASSLSSELVQDEELWKCLYQSATSMLVDAMSACLGVDSKTIAKLPLVNQLMHELQGKEGQRLSAVALSELEALEWETWEACAALHGQRLPWWLPRHGAASAASCLEALGGEVEIREFSVKAIEHFPTVKLGKVAITAGSGLWYFEVLMLTDGLMQIGYIDNEFVADAVQGQGVGDHNSSWAFDGFRRKKWNVNSYDYGDAWHTGDVVGVLLDTDRMELSYFLNGKFLGVAFTALPISATSLLYPAASLNADQIIQFNFGVAGANADLSKGPLDLTQMFVHVPMLDSDVDQSRLQPVVLAMGGTGEDSATALALTAQRVGMVEDGEVNEDEDGGASDDDDDEDDTGEQAGHADHTARSSSYAIREGMFAIGDDTAASDAHTLLLLAAGGSMRDTTQHSIPHDARLMYMIDDANSSDHVSRRNELIDGLTSIGLPRDWAIRCVTETTLSANKGSAVSWILEQMEKEFLSMPDSSISLLQALAQHSSSTTSSASSLSLAASRSADDLALLPSMVSSVVHPPSMFPTHAHSMLSRNYRPQTEQVTRSRGQHPFLFPADSSGSTEAKVPTTNNNPFLKAELEDAAVASESSWGARGSREGRYRRFGEVSMIRRILGHHSDIMGKVAEGERVKSSTVEELMQLWVATNSALCVVYARRCLWSLLLSATQDVSIPCTRLHDALLPANATYDERKRLVRFSRILLHLDPREAVDGMSDVDVTSHNSHVSIQLRAAMQQLLVTELENLPKSDANDHEPNTQSPDAVVSQMPIFHVLFEELNQQILHALATATMGRVDPSAEDAMATMANNAAWSLWVGTLLMTFAHDQLVKSDGVTPSPPFPAIPAASCWSIAFLQALMALAAAPSVVSTPWKVVALELMRHVVSSSQAVDSQSTWQSWFAFPSSVIMELVQVENLLDLLALRLRKEKSANVLASDLTQSLFRSLNAVFKAPVIHSLTLTPPPSTPLEVLVENLTASQVTVSWKRTETQEEETAVAQANEDDPPTETNIDSVALVSLEIVEVPVVRGEAWIQDEQKPLERVVLPRKGTYTVRNLAPDTMYVVRVKELPANGQEDSALEAKEALLQASVTFSTPQEPLFELDRDAMGKNLVLFNQNLSARNLMNKKWHTVRTTVAFEEGVHQWQVRIDKCVSKNIFVGVCTQQANLENYIGSDAFGYGFLANKAVWHNKTKLHSYGEIFKQGDLLQVTLDCNAKTLAFSRNGDYLGLAATNMHVPGGSTTDGTRCKWYPAFSMYNKDDQLTIIPPSPAASVSKIGRQQNVSVLQLVDSMRVLQMHNTSASAPERVPDVTHTHVLASAFAFWQRWKRGEALVRETEQGRYIVLDAREAITAKYGYAQGDVVFTGKGQCTVLGEHNHVLYYELEDGVGGSTITSAPVLQLNAWTLHACKEMQRSSSDFPVHRRPRGRFFELTEPSESASPPQTASPDDDDPSVLSAFVKAQQAWDSSLDGSLMAVLSQVAANRAVKDLWHVTYNDLHNAQELTEFAASVTVGSSDGLDDRKCLVMDRVAWLLFVNQHIYNVVSVALSDLPDPRATCALQVVGRTDKGTPRALNDVNPQHMVAQVLAATRFVTQTMETLDLVHGLPTVARWAKTLMLEGQKAQLLDRFICSTATNSVTFDAPRSPAESTAGEDGASTGASGLATIHVRLHEPGIIPFWRSPSLATVFTSYAIPPEALEDNGASMFVHVSRQLANIDAVELRRQCAMPFDSFPITRSLQFTIMNRSTAKSKSTGQSKELTGHQNAFDAQFGGDVDLLDHHPLQEPMQNAADQCLQYLQVFEELMKEVQSPAFPLFVPRRPDPTLQLRINTDLFKSTSLLTMQLSHDQVLVWFYHFGQLLGTAWRNKLVLPLQFLDERVWDLVLDPCFQDDVKAQQRGLDAWEQHTEHTAINAIRDGVFSIVPSRCAHLMTGASLRRRIVDRHVTLISDLEHIAVFDKNSATHQLFWRVVRQFTSLERQMLLQFLTGKYHHRANASATTSLPVLDLQDSLPDSHDHPDACYPIVEPVSAALTRLYLPAYSTEAVLRRKLTLAMTNLPML
ncbi:TPA: hypothetical protein N0F65_010376 [Lagenidium giganteum]|uniref:B30.2/SPRY domain-containing protein n=1 Tax=Lagenidium giganteum TaxID=4803 RepID=A0AAV2YGD6_9STRA|nr:TPA: hypothetical protein N0F65_010376 [Lagenidium giganteum]